MKQESLFGEEFAPKEESKYTDKIKIPVYQPKNKKPHILELYDDMKTKRLIIEINSSDIAEDEKKFLIEAAKRHTVFNYSKVADYYANSSKPVQQLMEKSALVIIDFEKAIEYGYAKLTEQTTQNYLSDYGDVE